MPRRDAYDDDDDAGAEMPWDALGRGTPAGRALFNLYNGDSNGKRYGNLSNNYNVNRMKSVDPTTKRLPPQLEASLKKEAEVTANRAKSRVSVPVPSGRRHLTEQEETELSFLRAKYATRCRKGESEIRAEMAADPEWARPIPAPSRPLLGEAEKTRLQRLREFNGRLPEDHQPVVKKRGAGPAAPEYKNDYEVVEDMFAKVTLEIEEREQFLADMRAAGRGEKHETAIKAEIATRVRQLRTLDAKIKQMEAEAGL